MARCQNAAPACASVVRPPLAPGRSQPFTRSFTLPTGIETDDIKASYDQGILTVRVPMPKAAKTEAKRITIAK